MKLARLGILWLGLLCGCSAVAQWQPPSQDVASSANGQFTVHGSRPTSLLYRYPGLKNDPDLVQFDPALLAVSASHGRTYFLRQLGWQYDPSWTGKIYFYLHPAQSVDEPVSIVTYPFAGSWDYRVEMPDLVTRVRFAQALAGVVLLERANARAPVNGESAPLPAWLADGLAQNLLHSDNANILFSEPDATINGLPQSRLSDQEKHRDPLATARAVLQQNNALTFDQLSWPDEVQQSGQDGGVYFASAQLFVAELLARPDGPANLRSFLSQLAAHLNWQTAFYAAFQHDFNGPLAVEKWWALHVILFTSQATGPRWSLAASRVRLDNLLRIPAEIRTGTNDLPQMADLSLQQAIRTFAPPLLAGVFENRLRDLQLAEGRLAPPFVPLAQQYAGILSDYLGDPHRLVRVSQGGRGQVVTRAVPTYRPPPPALVKKLDALDARRQALVGELGLNQAR